ncbi:MAG: hypothetical protein J3K34DRAFT_464874 [Monoraphidium minutum]|nr:MAG: hypothetical protein J3K34DRAFT_464874 [Monoraphidium minutum]
MGRVLTSRIKAAADLAALEQLEAQHGGAFGYIQAAAAFTRAAHLAAACGAPPRAASRPLLRRLWRRLQPQLGQCGPRELANTVWACGKLGFAEAPLLDACLARLCRAAADARPQHLSNAVYAAALLWDSGYRVSEQQARQLVVALVERRQEAKPQELSNTLWAAATMGLPLPEEQAQQLVAALAERRQEAKPQGVSNTLWAAARMGLPLPEQQARQLVAALAERRQEAKPQELSNTLWAAATMGLPLPEEQARQLVAALAERRQEAKPQDVSNTLWAAARMGLPLPEQQARQLVAALAERRQEAKPQELSNTLWAAATMGLPLPEEQARQLVAALVERRQEAKPQDVSNTLWAAARMGLPLPEEQARQLVAALAAKARQAAPQNVSNALWAAAKRKAEPAAAAVREGSVTAVEAALMQLLVAVSREHVARYNAQDVSNSLWALSELRLRPPWPTALLSEAALQRAPAMAPQHLSNTALALARLGVDDARLFAALVAAAAQQLQHLGAQATANLAWAAADGQPAAGAGGDGVGGGLAGVLSAVQLQQCAAAWEAQLQQTSQQRRTPFERRVFECARRLPCLADCRQEARTPDGAFSVDVAATHAASGRRLAIEADGPTHFLRPGREPTGDTLARNRAHMRGFAVVSVPWWEWQKVRGDAAAQDAYLLRKVQVALSAQQEGASKPQRRRRRRDNEGPGGGGAAAAKDAAAAAALWLDAATRGRGAYSLPLWFVQETWDAQPATYRRSNVLERAACHGDVATLEWAWRAWRAADVPVPCWLSASVCAAAAEGGSLAALQWLRQQTPPCPWDSRVVDTAARRGRLPVL